MGKKFQVSFAAGELDPALQERVDLDKFQNGLATGRNVIIGKTGRILSRPGRKLIRAVTEGNDVTRKIFLKALNDGFFAEVGVSDVNANKLRITPQNYEEVVLGGQAEIDIANENLQSVSLVVDGEEEDSDGIKSFSVAARGLGGGRAKSSIDFIFESSNDIPAVTLVSNTLGGTGYDVEYMATVVIDRVERWYGATASPVGAKFPAAGEDNEMLYRWGAASHYKELPPDEVRIYRRPKGSGGWGFVGSGVPTTGTPPQYNFTFIDYGQEADFSNQPPEGILGVFGASDIEDNMTTIGLHQGRLIVCKEGELYASMSGQPTLILRQFPFTPASAVSVRFEKGETKILWVTSRDDLIVFTTSGIFANRGVLSFDNLAFTKRGDWICDQDVAPIIVPGGLLFVDANTNTVRDLVWSDARASYLAEELSIFSDHLFRDNKITSWAFQGGDTPFLYVTFSDGTGAVFTYEVEHELKAWTRVDSFNNVEYVASLKIPEDDNNPPRTDLIFITNYDGDRYIERSVRRTPTVNEMELNPEADKGESIAAMDSFVSWSELINDDLTDDDMTLTPVIADTWDGELTLAVTDDAIFPSPGYGAVGTIFRWFNPVDRTSIDLEVTARASDNSITVSPSEEFPSAYATNPRLYLTATTVSGLSHLEGLKVAIISDGYVLASPNNDIEGYPDVTVSSGSITLPASARGAIVHVGLPYTMDIETLEIASTGQGRGLQYTREESITVNKLTVKTKDTRGLYVGSRFPDNDKLLGSDITGTNMLELDGFNSYDVNYENEDTIVGNRYDQPVSKRVEMTLPGDWNTNGKVCLRQVDPLHFEILSIVPNVEIREE